MTDRPPNVSPSRGLAAWARRCQQQINDTAHDAGDAYALARGWTITATTGRFGMSGRTYRDPRFDTRTPVPPHRSQGLVQPVRLATALDEWTKAQNPAWLAGWTTRPAASARAQLEPEAGA